jgi:hypothetical protein
VDNLTTKETLHYNDITVRLREIIFTKQCTTTNTTQPAAAFIAQKGDEVYEWCKANKGWSGKGHLEKDCRTKKRESKTTLNTSDHQQAHF